ncbi:enoyl-CoA hydratase/isomerase family protein [Brevibacterium litoralis]|uniref:enoyl-CoA hydratase/isomerase family protein n=1 Tax=Brevibacterium litoralis TaxID=3138935 RepID=UPI0032EC2603
MGELVLRTDHDGWTELRLNRPEKLNALTVAMFSELRAHVTDLATDTSVRCVVLRGAGKCFSAGRIAAQSPFSHAANKELLDSTDAVHLDAGLVREVMDSRGMGPDARDRIAAFTDQTDTKG